MTMTKFRTRIPPLDIARLLVSLSVLLPLTATEHYQPDPPDDQQGQRQPRYHGPGPWYQHPKTTQKPQEDSQYQNPWYQRYPQDTPQNPWYQQGSGYQHNTQHQNSQQYGQGPQYNQQYGQNPRYRENPRYQQNPSYQQQDSQWNPSYQGPQFYRQQDAQNGQNSGQHGNPQYQKDEGHQDSHGANYQYPQDSSYNQQDSEFPEQDSQYQNTPNGQYVNPQYQQDSMNQQDGHSARQYNEQNPRKQKKQNSGRRQGSRNRRRQDLNGVKPERKRNRKSRQNPRLQENPLYRKKSDRQRIPQNQRDSWDPENPNFGATGRHQEPQHTGPDYERPPLQDSVYLTPNQTTVTARVGNKVHLPCVIQHLGTKQVSWYRDHEEHILTIGHITWVRNSNVIIDYREYSNDVTHWNLTISRVKTEDEGIYNCEIIDKKKMINQVRLRVMDPPEYKPEIRIYGKEYVDLGEQVRLVCNATGGDLIPEDIDWFKDGDIVDSMRFKNVIITKYRSLEDQALVSELIIDRSKGEDSGTYICRSSENQIDSMEVTVLVANSSNVKRGSGSGSGSQQVRSEHPFNKAALHIRSSLNLSTVMAVLTLAFLQLWTS